MAAAAGGSAVPGEGGSWASACPQGQRAQGREWAAPPPRTNKAARAGRAQGGVGGAGSGHSPEGWRAGAGGPGPGAGTAGPECAPATGRGQRAQCPRRGPGAPRRGQGPRAGLDSATARCGNRSAGAGSGARRPGQRRRRLPLLLPRSLLPRVLLLAGSPPPPPPQPRRFSGFSSPSRPGRPAGTIPETLQSTGACEFPLLKMKQRGRADGFFLLLCLSQVEPICKDPHKLAQDKLKVLRKTKNCVKVG
ncbi:translation initiation factor IF-2-like [Panthera leo]|uniref:translation initiation factor IF-2-like n=1 Tax=Panthera leo TaxID=9689 RepID=UPI001C6A7AE7|nr:translation initiation factor IF-2-like [Panthera leo]